MSKNSNDDVVSMIKRGCSEEEIKEYINSTKKVYPDDFTSFMNSMLKKHGIKRKDIVDITGLSQDYTYKLINGSKKTKERDYIIAICLACELNLPEFQHALMIYGFQQLDKSDTRDNILIHAIEDYVSYLTVNEWLEKANLPYLKTSPDMPTYIPQYSLEDSTEEESNAKSNIQLDYKELSRQIEAEYVGPAPMDYHYYGIIDIEDSDHHKWNISATYQDGLEAYAVLNEENHNLMLHVISEQEKLCKLYEKNQIEDTEFQSKMNHYTEIYNSIAPEEEYLGFENTINSKFFLAFLELDKATDEKARETMQLVNDTKNFGSRIGMVWSNQKISFVEYYDSNHPAQQQYLQIREYEDHTIFSASHESVFMKFQLEDFYECYFNDTDEPLYFINEKSITDVKAKYGLYYSSIFSDLLVHMHDFFKTEFEDDSYLSLNDTDERTDSLAQKAAMQWNAKDYKNCLQTNLELISILDGLENKDKYLPASIVTCYKIITCYEMLHQFLKAQVWHDRLYNYKNYFKNNPDLDNDFLGGALNSVVDEINDRMNIARANDEMDKIQTYSKEIIDLLEDKCIDEADAKYLFGGYINLAFCLDDTDDYNDSLTLYEKAYKLIRRYRIDNIDECKISICTFYNNYGWLLWNKFHDEEAVYYYRRCIEQCETYLFEKNEDQDIYFSKLEHAAQALYKIYQTLSRKTDMNNLIKFTKKYGINL